MLNWPLLALVALAELPKAKKSTVLAGVKIFAVVKCKFADAVSWLTDKFPLALILPSTVNFSGGVSVPIPRLPQ